MDKLWTRSWSWITYVLIGAVLVWRMEAWRAGVYLWLNWEAPRIKTLPNEFNVLIVWRLLHCNCPHHHSPDAAWQWRPFERTSRVWQEGIIAGLQRPGLQGGGASVVISRSKPEDVQNVRATRRCLTLPPTGVQKSPGFGKNSFMPTSQIRKFELWS